MQLRTLGVKYGQHRLWLCMAHIQALLHTVAVAAGEQQCESDDY
jgi:hypothetical protein